MRKRIAGAAYYTLFKYLEIIISGLVMLFLAKKIGPDEMGKSISSMLYITYSSYLAFGMNSLIVKNYSRVSDDSSRLNFLTLNLQYFSVVCILNIGLCYLVLGQYYFIQVALISNINLFRSFYMAYYRVVNRVSMLNVNNIVFSVFLLIGVLFFTSSWKEYLVVWLLASFLCMIIYIFADFVVSSKLAKNIFSKPDLEFFLKNMKEGLKLAVVGVISTVFTTGDRFFINKLDLDLELKGTYQFADNIGMVIYVGLSSVVFYYTPTWIERVRNDERFVRILNRYSNIGLLLLAPLSICSYFISKLIRIQWYPEFVGLEFFVFFVVILKLLVIINGFHSLIFMGKDKESDYIRIMMIPIAVIILIGSLTVSFVKVEIYFFSVLISSVIFITLLYQRKVCKARYLK